MRTGNTIGGRVMLYFIPWVICVILLAYIVYMKIVYMRKTKASRNPKGSELDSSGNGNNKYSKFIGIVNDSIVNLSSSSNTLETYVNKIKCDIEGVSATTEELAAGIEETAASSQEISASVSEMENMILAISTETSVAGTAADEIRIRASELKQKSIDSKKETEEIYVSVKESLDKALEQSKAVSQIYTLADTILNIASQTKLLSVNANIEAARSGEQGRGFAVVANEINKLAKISSDTAENIKNSIENVKLSVNDLSESSERIVEFVDKNVLPDYENLINVSEQYYDDSNKFNDSISKINGKVEELCNTSAGISSTVDEMAKTTIDESAGIQEIASSINSIMERSNLIVECAANNAKSIESLAEESMSMN